MNTQSTSYSALVGHVVASFRQRAPKEQGELAQQIGLSQASYSRLEGGKAAWTIDHLMAVSGALGISVQDIIRVVEVRAEELRRAADVNVVPAMRGNSQGAESGQGHGAFLAGAALGALLATLISKT